MKAFTHATLLLGLLFAGPMAVAWEPATESQSEAAPGPAQIEADWLRQLEVRWRPQGEAVAADQDASGGVDGVKNGKWGFHTQNESNPWWQVDLGQAQSINQVVIYNRCEGGMAERNARVIILASLDGQGFREVYRHDGTVFYGQTDGKPLVAALPNVEARYVRLALEGQSYFHLDEVEVRGTGSEANLALGKPATQSSVSQWSVTHAQPTRLRTDMITRVIERGTALCDRLSGMGVDTQAARAALAQIAGEAGALPVGGEEEGVLKALYARACAAVRQVAFQNPLLDFDSILFVKRAPGQFPHMSDQHYGWWSRPGGGIFVLSGFRTGEPSVRCLTAEMSPGSFIGPDLSHDGQRVIFAYCHYDPAVADSQKGDKSKLPESSFYHIFEMNIDGSDRRQLTAGRYDDFDPRYLPGGEIAFLSTRKGLALQSSAAYADSTRSQDLPDSYVRCGGDNFRPVPVFTLHAMSATGDRMRPLSAFENFEWTPSVAADGRVLYTRWDYIDRFNGHFFSLWSANQDGGNPQLVYGNYTVRPQVVCEARSIPGSSKLIFTAAAHHSITGGSLCLLDRAMGTEGLSPLTRLTPEVCFPETEGWPDHYYANPWPLSENFFLTAWSDRRMPPHCRVSTEEENPSNALGIYLLDAFGNQELLYRDPAFSSMYPIPVKPRPVPQRLATPAAGEVAAKQGQLLLQDVYAGLDGVARGEIKSLRVVAVPPKVQPFMNNPVLGVSAEDTGKYVLGTVPVESDGSAHFVVPAAVPVFFQALDEEGLAVQTMRSLTYVFPGKSLGCVGCHEHRDTAPSSSGPTLASRRGPSQLKLGPEGSWPLRFDKLVQPVLDQSCVSCHRADSGDATAARFDLTPGKAYDSLLAFAGEDLKKLAFERDQSLPGSCVTRNSKLWALLTSPAGHAGVTLDQESRARLSTWMDTYTHRVGSFSDEQERQLIEFRSYVGELLDQASSGE